MPATVDSVSGDQVRLRLAHGQQVTARSAATGLRTGDRAQAVVRPEKLEVTHAERPATGDGPSVEGVVESAVYLGTATQMIVRLAGDVPMTVLVPNVDEARRQQLPGAGARVRLAWSPEH